VPAGFTHKVPPVTEITNPTPPHPLPAGIVYREWRGDESQSAWTLSRALPYGGTTGTGGRGVPTLEEWTTAAERVQQRHPIEGER
jgi:hypothetical protein